MGVTPSVPSDCEKTKLPSATTVTAGWCASKRSAIRPPASRRRRKRTSGLAVPPVKRPWSATRSPFPIAEVSCRHPSQPTLGFEAPTLGDVRHRVPGQDFGRTLRNRFHQLLLLLARIGGAASPSPAPGSDLVRRFRREVEATFHRSRDVTQVARALGAHADARFLASVGGFREGGGGSSPRPRGEVAACSHGLDGRPGGRRPRLLSDDELREVLPASRGTPAFRVPVGGGAGRRKPPARTRCGDEGDEWMSKRLVYTVKRRTDPKVEGRGSHSTEGRLLDAGGGGWQPTSSPGGRGATGSLGRDP